MLHRSVVRSAADVNHRYNQVLIKSDVQDSLNLLDKNSSFAFKISYPKFSQRAPDLSQISKMILDLRLILIVYAKYMN